MIVAHEVASRRPRGELRFIVVGAVLVVFGVALVTALGFLAAQRLDIDFSVLSRDPASVVGAPPYTGWFANITILVWLVPAAVGLFAAMVMRRAGVHAAARMFLVVGLISTVMVGDDFFQGHEILKYNLGVPGPAVFVVYTLAALGWLWWFRDRLGAHVLTGLAAMGWWGVSAVVDTLLDENAPYVLEDGAKLAGVAMWAFLVVRVALVEIAGLLPGAPHIPEPRTASASARHRGPGEPSAATGATDGDPDPDGDPAWSAASRTTEVAPRGDPEATTPVRAIPLGVAPPPAPALTGPPPRLPARPGPPRGQAPRPVPGPPPAGPRHAAAQPARARNGGAPDLRGPATPPPVPAPGAVQRPPHR
ncbi:hypothetical protein [Pseudonocardia sp.]|uniref:hypothetical protein n=1 Tax=Pseudonocardia sp. TaxID=60912 RepID=UPI0026324447|nr:hypothetical protein [Pseudonocardia sp.]